MPPGPEDYDADGEAIHSRAERQRLLDPEKSSEPIEQYARHKPGKGQSGFNFDDDSPADPEFEAKHPRGSDGEFVEKGEGRGDSGSKPDPAKALAQIKPAKETDSAKAAKEHPNADAESLLDKSDESSTQPPETDDPRADADALFDMEQEEQYKYARKSAVSNVGEDVTGSARHKANAWRSLEDAERNGTAEKLVTRANLLKNEPHRFVTLADDNPLGSMVMYLALQRFPPKPGYGSRKVSEEDARKNREQYLEAYRSIKDRAEEIAANQNDPVAASKLLQSHINGLINRFREGDRHNATANGLIGLLNQLGTYGMRKKNSPVYRMVEFAALYRKRYGEEKADPEKLAEHVKDVMDGKSFNATFGVESEGAGPQWKPSDRYVKHAERKGGVDLDVGTPEKAHEYMTSTLGLRAVQYGNYVTDDERKHHATKAAEAFADLADAIGLPVEYVSWKGELGLAIGARGHGNASAHYEPGSKMMNLTRASGVGAVAHEWGHFFDNMLTGGGLRGGGTERIEGDYASEQTSPVRITKDADEAAMLGGEEFSGNKGFWKIDKSKDPLWKAMADVRQSWRDSGYVKRLSKAMRNLGLSDGRRKYFAEVKEVFARSFEKYVEHKLGERDQKNTYLTGLAPDASEDTDLWPTATEIKEMAPAFDSLMKAFRGGVEKGRYAMRYSDERGPYLERYASEIARLRYHLDRAFCERGIGSAFAPSDEARLSRWLTSGIGAEIEVPDRFGQVYRYSRSRGNLSVEKFQARVPKGSKEGGEFTGPGAAISALVEESLKAPKGRRPEGFKPKTVTYREIDEAEAARIREATGLDVAGYSHSVDQYAVEHILKKHGSEEVVSGDEIPVTREDIARIPEITSDPDELVRVGKTNHELDGIRYKKRVNGYIFFVEEVRTAKKRLAATTMWKVRRGGRDEDG